MSFAEPTRLWWLAAPLTAAVLAAFRHHRRHFQQRQLASPAVWQRLMGGVPATGLVRLQLWSLAAAMAVVALAKPQWGQVPVTQSLRTRDLVLALDVSDSMLCPDQPPSRLVRSLAEIRRALPQLAGNRIGVVVFAGDAYPLVPLTTDLEAVTMFLEGVEPGMVGQGGTDLQRAVTAAVDLLPAEGEGRVVVLVSDGESLQGDPAAASGLLRRSGVRLLALLAGTPNGGPIPLTTAEGRLHYKVGKDGRPVVTRCRQQVLEQVAAVHGGEVIPLAAPDAVRRLVTCIEKMRSRELEMTRTVQRVDRFPLLAGIAAALVAAGFAVSPWRRSTLVAAGLVALLPLRVAVGQSQTSSSPGTTATRVPADGTEQPALLEIRPALWQRLVLGGSRRLARSGLVDWQQGDRQAATKAFAVAWHLDQTNPDRLFDLGTALAAAGHLQAAVPFLREAHQRGAPAAAFNLGTAALLQGDADLAVAWLRLALLAEPQSEDVRRNYELALRLLARVREQEQSLPEEPGAGAPTSEQQASRRSSAPRQTQMQPNASAVYSALQRAETEARRTMEKSTRSPATEVAEDW